MVKYLRAFCSLELEDSHFVLRSLDEKRFEVGEVFVLSMHLLAHLLFEDGDRWEM